MTAPRGSAVTDSALTCPRCGQAIVFCAGCTRWTHQATGIAGCDGGPVHCPPGDGPWHD